MLTILIIVVIILAIGSAPTWPYSRSWGPYPSGLLGLIGAAPDYFGAHGSALVCEGTLLEYRQIAAQQSEANSGATSPDQLRAEQDANSLTGITKTASLARRPSVIRRLISRPRLTTSSTASAIDIAHLCIAPDEVVARSGRRMIHS